MTKDGRIYVGATVAQETLKQLKEEGIPPGKAADNYLAMRKKLAAANAQLEEANQKILAQGAKIQRLMKQVHDLQEAK